MCHKYVDILFFLMKKFHIMDYVVLLFFRNMFMICTHAEWSRPCSRQWPLLWLDNPKQTPAYHPPHTFTQILEIWYISRKKCVLLETRQSEEEEYSRIWLHRTVLYIHTCIAMSCRFLSTHFHARVRLVCVRHFCFVDISQDGYDAMLCVPSFWFWRIF